MNLLHGKGREYCREENGKLKGICRQQAAGKKFTAKDAANSSGHLA
ncbi:MAG: hypothetical protein KF862_10330 [Chitinophagaceae bacterium]|nr:hypothetical protein [Chitinophagaceae bacterium]